MRDLARTPVTCAECGREDDSRERGWQGHETTDGDIALFCPDCAEREFGAGSEVA